MGVPYAVRKQAEEAERLQKQMIEGDTEASTTPAAKKPVEEKPAEPATPAQPTAASDDFKPLDKPLGDDDANWQSRYQTLQGKYNAEVPKLKADIKRLTEQLANSNGNPGRERELEQQVRELTNRLNAKPAAPVNSPGLDKLREDYGGDLVDGLLSYMQASLAPLQQKLTHVEQTVGESRKVSAQDRLVAALRTTGHDFDQIDSDPLFMDWLREVDGYSGETRHTLMLRAYNKGEIDRAAKFYRDYAGGSTQKMAGAEPGADPLAQHVKPKQTSVDPTKPQSGSAWNPETIAQFYEQLRRGKFAPDEAKRLEAEIFAYLNQQQ